MLLYFSLLIYAASLGASLVGRASRDREARFFAFFRDPTKQQVIAKYSFIVSIIGVFLLLIYASVRQYEVWSGNELAKLLLPPYNTTYFLTYIGFRFFAPYCISFIISLGFLKIATFYNKKYEERFFYPEERYWGALALFLSGHPGWLLYLFVLLLSYMAFHFIVLLLKRGADRLSLYYFWLPAGMFAILLQVWLAQFPWWQKLLV